MSYDQKGQEQTSVSKIVNATISNYLSMFVNQNISCFTNHVLVQFDHIWHTFNSEYNQLFLVAIYWSRSILTKDLLCQVDSDDFADSNKYNLQILRQ